MNSDIYWIDSQLAISARPRGGDWLAGEVAHWAEAGVDVVGFARTDDGSSAC